MRAGPEAAPGRYVVTGRGWKVTSDASGHRVLHEGSGTVENLCEMLAG
ncbi:MAG TPA: hypothetical protein VFJ12_13485 [Segeticoccus sp.]|nr:hypothetical protein [Segeticoccus sp.]